ncbi:transcriptional regulator [Vibrio sp. T187]|uniref:winged helix-turn-helix domain-containing protein n=1 Tax=Vibrio TaxID=662 RepID=UPI0010C99BE5|nr:MULTISPECIES: winged helix-turn-helix domain-containing protein [Vibrio]MBW3698621.1 transcriptional regulator [Vibrio sp. T187]
MVDKRTCYSIDEWSFVPNEGQVIFATKTISLDKRLSRLLDFLCQHPQQTHTRDELIDHVWNGMILTDQVVTQAVFELRKVLKQHSTSNSSYIVTVPKRGYKFEAEVLRTQLGSGEPTLEDNTHPIEPNTGSISHSPTTTEQNDNQTDHRKTTKRRYSMIALLAAIVTLESGYILYSASQKPTSIMDNADIRHFESRYVVLELSEDIENDPLLFGIVTKFIEYVGIYSNIRIVHSEPLQRIAAINLKFGTSPSRDGQHTRLTMRYHNNVSNQSHLSRRYSTELSSLHQTLYSMIDDMLTALYTDIPQAELSELISQLPTNNEALRHTLIGLGILYNRSDLDLAFEHISKAKALAPDNDFVYVAHYVGEVINAFYSGAPDTKTFIAQINQAHRARLEALLEQGTIPRAYDANAIVALSEDDPERAMRILREMPRQYQSILTYLLLAKAEESRGNSGAAKELYLKATQSNSSLKAIRFASPLFFDSNLEPLLKELE